MSYLVLFFGILIALAGAALLVRPDMIFRLFAKYVSSILFGGFLVYAVI